MEIDLNIPPKPEVRVKPPRPTVEEVPHEDLPHVRVAQPKASKYDFEADPEPTTLNPSEPTVKAEVDNDSADSASFKLFEHIQANRDL